MPILSYAILAASLPVNMEGGLQASGHAIGFTLFKNDGIGLSEVDDPDDPVVMIEAVFRLSRSCCTQWQITRKGKRSQRGMSILTH